MSPAVSVVLPTYNRAGTLLRSVNSVLGQTFGDLELIIVDDGSTDNTATIVRDIKDARVRYVELDRNRGQSVARNVGISHSNAALIAFQDSDDTWRHDKLIRQVSLLETDVNLGGVYCDLLRIPLNGEPHILEAPNLVIGATFDQRPSLYQTHLIGIQSCLLRREALRRIGPFREDMRCFEDLELLLRLSKKYRLCRISLPLVNWFEGPGVSSNEVENTRARILLFRRYGYRAIITNRKAWLGELKFCLRRMPSL